MYIGLLHVKCCRLFLSDFNETWFFQPLFEKYSHIRFHKNSPSGSPVVPWGRTEGREANSCFRNFSKTPKTHTHTHPYTPTHTHTHPHTHTPTHSHTHPHPHTHPHTMKHNATLKVTQAINVIHATHIFLYKELPHFLTGCHFLCQSQLDQPNCLRPDIQYTVQFDHAAYRTVPYRTCCPSKYDLYMSPYTVHHHADDRISPPWI
jgi:hypothetical protein